MELRELKHIKHRMNWRVWTCAAAPSKEKFRAKKQFKMVKKLKKYYMKKQKEEKLRSFSTDLLFKE